MATWAQKEQAIPKGAPPAAPIAKK